MAPTPGPETPTQLAAPDRYDRMPYWRVGASGLRLSSISLGLWQNFGDDRALETQRAIVRHAFDLRVTHLDLGNNYGPPYESAEANFGRILASDLRPGQTLAQMAIAWTLRDPRVASALIGASSVEQLDDNLTALDGLWFTPDELAEIDRFAVDGGINLWARSSSA